MSKANTIPCVYDDDCSIKGMCSDDDGPIGCNFWRYPCSNEKCEENKEGICTVPDTGITCKERVA